LVKCREEAGTTADGIAKFRAANWGHFKWLSADLAGAYVSSSYPNESSMMRQVFFRIRERTKNNKKCDFFAKIFNLVTATESKFMERVGLLIMSI
jgi:hypothetical protein